MTDNHDAELAEAQVRRQGFMASVTFAVQAGKATGQVPIEVLEDCLAYGEELVQPGIALDDALELEYGLRMLRCLLVYRQTLEGESGLAQKLLNTIKEVRGADRDTGEVEADRGSDAGADQEGPD